jgi:hypothetical protein
MIKIDNKFQDLLVYLLVSDFGQAILLLYSIAYADGSSVLLAPFTLGD